MQMAFNSRLGLVLTYGRKQTWDKVEGDTNGHDGQRYQLRVTSKDGCKNASGEVHHFFVSNSPRRLFALNGVEEIAAWGKGLCRLTRRDAANLLRELRRSYNEHCRQPNLSSHRGCLLTHSLFSRSDQRSTDL